TIDTVAAGGNCGFTGADGLLSHGNGINLRTGTSLLLNRRVNAGAGNVRIVAGTTVNQAVAGIVTANQLGILAGGAVTLCAAPNDLNLLAIETTGLIEVNDTDDLTIDTVAAGGNCGFTGADGLFSHGDDVNVHAGSSLL